MVQSSVNLLGQQMVRKLDLHLDRTMDYLLGQQMEQR